MIINGLVGSVHHHGQFSVDTKTSGLERTGSRSLEAQWRRERSLEDDVRDTSGVSANILGDRGTMGTGVGSACTVSTVIIGRGERSPSQGIIIQYENVR